MKNIELMKWNFIVENDGKFNRELYITLHPEVEKLINLSAFCNKYYHTRLSCKWCEMRIRENDCNDYIHPYTKWFINNNKENAIKMLEFVKSIE